MDETKLDIALNLDSSGTFELGRTVVPAEAEASDNAPPDFPRPRRRCDPQHREFLAQTFDAADSPR